MPNKEQVIEFITDCIDASEKTRIKECNNRTLREYCGIYRGREESDPEYQKVIPHLAAAKKACFEAYARGVARKHRPVSQMLGWASTPIWASSEFKTSASTLRGPSSFCIPNPLAFGGVRNQVRLKTKLP